MILRNGTLFLLIFLALACANETISDQDIDKAVAACNGEEACAIASITAAQLNTEVGKNFGHGVTFKGAQSEDKILFVKLEVPTSIETAPVQNGLTAEQQIAEGFRGGFCDNDGGQKFFSLGGEIHLLSYLPSGRKFSRSIVSSC